MNFDFRPQCVEYKDTRGIDAIATRMQNGKKSCRVFEEYLRDRCKCEEEHCRRLLKCVQVSEVNAVTGTLKSGFVALISSVQKTIDLHSEKANAYHRAAQEISQFRQRQKMEIDAVSSISTVSKKVLFALIIQVSFVFKLGYVFSDWYCYYLVAFGVFVSGMHSNLSTLLIKFLVTLL